MKHRAPERLSDMKSWEAREMMVSNLVLKPLLTTQPLRSKTLLWPVNGAMQSAGVYFFSFIPGNRQLREVSAKICGSV